MVALDFETAPASNASSTRLGKVGAATGAVGRLLREPPT